MSINELSTVMGSGFALACTSMSSSRSCDSAGYCRSCQAKVLLAHICHSALPHILHSQAHSVGLRSACQHTSTWTTIEGIRLAAASSALKLISNSIAAGPSVFGVNETVRVRRAKPWIVPALGLTQKGPDSKYGLLLWSLSTP
jgi:hypothetical protein